MKRVLMLVTIVLALLPFTYLPASSEELEVTSIKNVVAALTEDRLVSYIMSEQKLITKKDAEQIVISALHWSKQNNVPILVTLGVIQVETLFRPYSVSKADAHGLMQIVPEIWTAEFARLNIEGFPEDVRELHDIDTGIRWGTQVLKVLYDRHKTWGNAVCKYNPKDCQKYLSEVKNASISLVWSSM
jgi:soluble lytic murein transglycosylase-like protein